MAENGEINGISISSDNGILTEQGHTRGRTVNLALYRLPGDPAITQRDLDRYINGNETLEKVIPTSRIREGLSAREEIDTRIAAATNIRLAPIEDRATLIRIALTDSDPDFRLRASVHLRAAENIGSALVEDRADLIEAILTNPELKHAYTAASSTIVTASAERQNDLLRQAFNLPGLDADFSLVQGDFPPPSKEWLTLLQDAIADPSRRNKAIRNLELAPIEDRTELVRAILKDHSSRPFSRNSAIARLEIVPPENRADLLRIALIDPQLAVREVAARNIDKAPVEERMDLLRIVLNDTSRGAYNIQIGAAKNLGIRVPRELFSDPSSALRHISIANVISEPTEDRTSLLRTSLTDTEWPVRRTAILNIAAAPAESRMELFRTGITDPDEGVKKAAISQLAALTESERRIILNEYSALFTHKKELAGKTKLYESLDEDDHSLTRDFKKSGSKTVLYGGPLHERIIRRIIPKAGYLPWAQAFEADTYWQENGFDYVPVEPIVQVRQDSDELLVDVDTRVLTGPSLATWANNENTIEDHLYKEEIQEQIEKIKKGLKEMGIEHGHLHKGNFVLVFHKDLNNEPDLSRPPRVYIIDFDRSGSDNTTK